MKNDMFVDGDQKKFLGHTIKRSRFGEIEEARGVGKRRAVLKERKGLRRIS